MSPYEKYKQHWIENVNNQPLVTGQAEAIWQDMFNANAGRQQTVAAGMEVLTVSEREKPSGEQAKAVSEEAKAHSERARPPSSSSVLWAAWRAGLKDLQNAVLNPWNGHVATHEEPGAIAVPTQAEVTAEKGTVHGFQESVLDGYAVRGGMDKGKDKAMER